MEKKVKRVGIYIRVSTSMQVEHGYSLEGQEYECSHVARKLFGQECELITYVDRGKSAKYRKNRHELNKMVNDAIEGRLDVVITYKVSRLARNLSDSLKIVEKIHNSNVRFISIKEGEYGTPHGNLQFNILSSVAQYQREELAENVRMGMTQRAREGKYNGGIVLGYKSVNKELVIVPEEAEIVKIIFNKYVNENWGTKRIANYLNKIGKRTKRNNQFAQSTVNIILKNPIYKGYIRFNQVIDWENKRRKGTNPNYILEKGIHEPIIDEDLWDMANNLMKKRSTGTPRQYSGRFPLTSIAKCPQCGSYMTSMYGSKRKDGSKLRYYVCGRYHNGGKAVCNPNTVNAERLEKQVYERLAKALQSETTIKAITENINKQISKKYLNNHHNEEIEVINKRISDLKHMRKRIQDDVMTNTGFFTHEEAKERISEIREEISELKDSLSKLLKEKNSHNHFIKKVSPDLIRTQLNEFLELKEQLDIMEFRQLLVACIEKIEISNKKLKSIQFSFITHIPESGNPEDSSLHSKVTSNSPILLRGLYFPENRYLFVVRFPPLYLKRPIHLLQQN